MILTDTFTFLIVMFFIMLVLTLAILIFVDLKNEIPYLISLLLDILVMGILSYACNATPVLIHDIKTGTENISRIEKEYNEKISSTSNDDMKKALTIKKDTNILKNQKIVNTCMKELQKKLDEENKE